MKWIILWAMGATLTVVHADEREEDRQALRALAARYEEAINTGSFAGLGDSVGPEMSAVFVTGVELHGLEEMQAYYDKIMSEVGAGGSFTVKLEPDATEFFGAMAIAHGNSNESVVTGGGRHIDYRTVWTAVLEKVDGRWRGHRLHVSMDPIDNPFVRKVAAVRWASLVGGALAGAALALGVVFYRRRGKLAAG